MSGKLRSIIVDDEPLARRLLRSMLTEHPDVDVVAEFGDGDAAVDGIPSVEADLLFLDVQMPRRSGLEVLEALGPDPGLYVVFVTAYDQYALRAFEVNAIDYLLKPFDDARLAETLDRVRARSRARTTEGYHERLEALLAQLGERADHVEHIAVRKGERIYLQPVAGVELFESEGKYVRIFAGDREHTIRETMLQLDRILDPRTFIRISRSAIINVGFIEEIQPWFRGDFVVILKSGRKVNTTRSYRDALKRLIDRSG